MQYPIICDPLGEAAAILKFISPHVAATAASAAERAAAEAAALADLVEATDGAENTGEDTEDGESKSARCNKDGGKNLLEGTSDNTGQTLNETGSRNKAEDEKPLVHCNTSIYQIKDGRSPYAPLLPHMILILDPKRRVAASLCYPATCGFASHEIIRLLDAIQNSYYNEVGHWLPESYTLC